MGLFGKGDDYVDYTLLQKKGLLSAEQGMQADEDGYMNFGSTNSNESSESVANPFAGASPESSTSPASDNPLGSFFGAPADVATPSSETESSSESYFGSSSSTESSSYGSSSNSDEVNALKIKVEDLEYKLERALERIDSLQSSD